jgi:hypothetical protein
MTEETKQYDGSVTIDEDGTIRINAPLTEIADIIREVMEESFPEYEWNGEVVKSKKYGRIGD